MAQYAPVITREPLAGGEPLYPDQLEVDWLDGVRVTVPHVHPVEATSRLELAPELLVVVAQQVPRVFGFRPLPRALPHVVDTGRLHALTRQLVNNTHIIFSSLKQLYYH